MSEWHKKNLPPELYESWKAWRDRVHEPDEPDLTGMWECDLIKRDGSKVVLVMKSQVMSRIAEAK